MRKAIKFRNRWISFLIILTMLISIFPNITTQKVYAAQDIGNINFKYDNETAKWDIYWKHIDGTARVNVTYNDPKDSSYPEVTESPSFRLDDDLNAVIEMDFENDYIYNLKIELFDDDDVLIGEGRAYFLSGITFYGKSFNEMAVKGSIEDANPVKNEDGSKIISGSHSIIKFMWKMPKIYDEDSGSGIYISQADQSIIDRFESEGDINDVQFKIEMSEVSDNIKAIQFETYTTSSGSIAVEYNSNIIEVLPIDENGYEEFYGFSVSDAHGIKPGTQYEDIKIRMLFINNEDYGEPREVADSRVKFGNNGFPLKNIDKLFEGKTVNSIFTPITYEIYRVDIDKLEFRIKKIKSKNYNDLYYQIQDAGSIQELIEASNESNTGPKLKDSSISSTLGWGNIIVPINFDVSNIDRYYRVVVTDGDAQTPLVSLCINIRTLNYSTSKPPTPRDIMIEAIYDGEENVEDNLKIPVTKIKISMEKPLEWLDYNWEEFIAQEYTDEDICYNILLNTYTEDKEQYEEKVVGIGDTKTIIMPVKEKRYLVLGKKDFIEDPDDSDRVYVEIQGISLFSDLVSSSSIEYENNEDTNNDGMGDYPSFLVPNTTYYMRVFSSRLRDNSLIQWFNTDHSGFEESISYISPTVSFTTYPNNGLPVPLPNITLGIKLTEDEALGNTTLSGITVQFNKIMNNQDWKKYTDIIEGRALYYDLYLSESIDEDSFVIISSIENIYPDENIDIPITYLITQSATTSDGSIIDYENIRPNSTYYLKEKTRLTIDGETIGQSDFTAVRSITTPKIDSSDLSGLDRMPRTPVEFKEIKQNTTAVKATLQWLNFEQDVVYQMVCTTNKLYKDSEEEAYSNDYINSQFVSIFNELKPNTDSNYIIFDPKTNVIPLNEFNYDEENTKFCNFNIIRDFLKPNHLYYFSIRAIRNYGADDQEESYWVSIPVTTKMVEPPAFLDVVKDIELGFTIIGDYDTAVEDFELWYKKNEIEDVYTKAERSEYTIIKDGQTYYFRIYDLEPDTLYDIKVNNTDPSIDAWYDGKYELWDDSENVNPIILKTRDPYHEIEVIFEGDDLYEYFMEIKDEDQSNYVTLNYSEEGDSDYFYIKDNQRIQFYKEKTISYVEDNIDKYVYYALIRTYKTILPNGQEMHKQLETNKKYYIKVWARKYEDSIHIGPVNIRTDFNQDDYDSKEKEIEIENMFDEKIREIEKKQYWKISNENQSEVLIKGDKIIGLLSVYKNNPVIIDLREESIPNKDTVVYFPIEVFDKLSKTSAGITIRLNGFELAFNSNTINTSYLKEIQLNSGSLYRYIRINLGENNTNMPSDIYPSSDVVKVSVDLVGMSLSYSDILEQIDKILYQSSNSSYFETGIANKNLQDLFSNTNILSYRNHIDLEDYISMVVNNIEKELSRDLKIMFEGGNGYIKIINDSRNIDSFTNNARVSIEFSLFPGYHSPYIKYQNSISWAKIPSTFAILNNNISFPVKAPGEYGIFYAKIPKIEGNIDSETFEFLSKYNIDDVLVLDGVFYADSTLSSKDLLNIFANLLNKKMISGISQYQKLKMLGLDDIIDSRSINSEVTDIVAVSTAMKIYEIQNGVNIKFLYPSKTIFISNNKEIDEKYYKYILIAIDLGIIKLDENKRFDASKKTSQQEIVSYLNKVIKLSE